ncbi:hypothetical protein JB92DRAFT_3092073 [Gautieria morchelliformis]|nr:hypothetical protein JB92DRAFT_3092073 [Gautieria morchelliformis]
MAKMMLTWTRNGEGFIIGLAMLIIRYTPLTNCHRPSKRFVSNCRSACGATQETDPDTCHYYTSGWSKPANIAVKLLPPVHRSGKAAVHGWKCMLQDQTPRPVQVSRTSIDMASFVPPNPEHSPSPINPPPPYHHITGKDEEASVGVIHIGNTIHGQLGALHSRPSLTIALVLTSHSTTPSPSMFTIPDLPLPSHSSQYPASKGPTVPASSLDMPPSNQLAAVHTMTNSDSGYQSPPMYNGDTGAIETTHVPKET